MEQIRAAIIDDEQLVINNLVYLLKQFPHVTIVMETTDPIDALRQIREIGDVDVVFMDISMPCMNGIEAAARLFSVDPEIRVVFLTAYEQYALESFQANTVDYIVKPVTLRRLQHTLNKLSCLLQSKRQSAKPMEDHVLRQSEQRNSNKVIGFRDNHFYILDAKDVYYITMNEKTVFCYTRDAQYTLKHGLSYWEEKLVNMGFIRCHRAYIVNINHVEAYAPMFNSTIMLTLHDRNDRIMVSRSYIDRFKEYLGGI